MEKYINIFYQTHDISRQMDEIIPIKERKSEEVDPKVSDKDGFDYKIERNRINSYLE